MKFDVYALRNSSILYLYSQRQYIQIDPPYQRMGDVWTLDKKQLLIDSVINQFDIPKIYFHDLRDSRKKSKFRFAIIDGRQRLEAVWSFIDGDFPLSEDFEYLQDKEVKAAGFTYNELAKSYPFIKQVFDASQLSVFSVQTDDLDLIEEMFSRLNEAVPLNAAEKRNALGGPLPKIVRDIANLPFFRENIRISNRRYQHRDLSAKIVYLAHSDKVLDTKKIYLDKFFTMSRGKKPQSFSRTVRLVKEILVLMADTFIKNDDLLRSSGMIVVYFLLFEKYKEEGWKKQPSRAKFKEFEEARLHNRKTAADDITLADYDLLEFDRLNQTPNDAYAIKFRLDILSEFVRS